jgi:hypothetical protein
VDARDSDDRRDATSGSDGATWATAPADDLVRLICDDERHLEIGRSIPDGLGHITVRAGEWGYCTAGREDEPHVWTEVSARPVSAIRHSDPLGAPRAG